VLRNHLCLIVGIYSSRISIQPYWKQWTWKTESSSCLGVSTCTCIADNIRQCCDHRSLFDLASVVSASHLQGLLQMSLVLQVHMLGKLYMWCTFRKKKINVIRLSITATLLLEAAEDSLWLFCLIASEVSFYFTGRIYIVSWLRASLHNQVLAVGTYIEQWHFSGR